MKISFEVQREKLFLKLLEFEILEKYLSTYSSVCVAELLNVLVATDAHKMLVFCCILLRALGNVIFSVGFKVAISCSIFHLGQYFEKGTG